MKKSTAWIVVVLMLVLLSPPVPAADATAELVRPTRLEYSEDEKELLSELRGVSDDGNREIYETACSELERGNIGAARILFDELVVLSYLDSREMARYCEALELEADGKRAKAARVFSTLTVRDSVERAERLTEELEAEAQNLTIEESYEYAIEEDHVVIVRFIADALIATIPETIEGLPVTVIGEEAFCDRESLEAVTIPSGVLEIGDRAFSGCSSLTALTIPDGVTSIGENTFSGCQSLNSLIIPNSVSRLGDGALNECPALLADGVTLGNNFVIVNSVIYDKDMTRAISCLRGDKTREIEILEGVTAIGSGAFESCVYLEDVTFPDTLKTIEPWAFSGCEALAAVTIPEGVTSLGEYAFYMCYDLASVVMPDSLVEVGDGVFYDCLELTSDNVRTGKNFAIIDDCLYSPADGRLIAYLPETEKVSEDELFTVRSSIPSFDDESEDLQTFVIPEGIKYIGEWTFSGFQNLEHVVIPESVVGIGDFAFCNCPNLTTITLPDGDIEIGDNAFGVGKNVTIIRMASVS